MDGSLVGASAAVIVALAGWALARFLGRSAEQLSRSSNEGGTMQQQTTQLTDFDYRRLQSMIVGPRSKDPRDKGSVHLLGRRLDDVDVVPADRIGPNLVTMNSEVRVRDLDTQEEIVFSVVFPKEADPAAGKISVLAPLGMSVLGHRPGDDITWQTPGSLRRLRVDRVVYQPEREGLDGGRASADDASAAVCAAGWFA